MNQQLHSTASLTKPRFQVSEKAKMLFQPAPYKVMYGGRGGCKSWDMARALLILGMNRKLFIVCGRYIQKSIKESVKKLLEDQIELMGLGTFYRTMDTEIIGVNGTRFAFMGLRNNINSVKSTEAIDIMWVTEALPVVKVTWDVLLPTVRRDPPFGPFGQGSEIWVDFNPELDSDDTYKYWVVDPPDGAVVVECDYEDNPWFPAILQRQMLDMKKKDYDNYLTVWKGKTRKALAGAIYAKELGEAIEDGRVNDKVTYMKDRPVIVVADLGRADMTSLWFLQQVSFSHLAIDHYQHTGEDWPHYLDYIANTKYRIGGLWLPHDAKQKHISAKKSVWGQSREAYPQPGVVRLIPMISVAGRINLLRSLFPRLWIAQTKCADGMLALQHYKYGVHPETQQRTKEPLHNWASHSADSLGGYAVMLTEGNRIPPPEASAVRDAGERNSTSWMGR